MHIHTKESALGKTKLRNIAKLKLMLNEMDMHSH